MKLDNGTVLEAEEFAEEYAIFIVTEDERVPLPIGEYTLEDGTTLVVAEEGVIGSIGEKVEEPKEPEMEEEVKKEEEVQEMSYASKQELEEAVAEVKEMIEEVKAMIAPEEEEMEEEVKEEELSSEVSEIEVKEEELELSAELAKPASQPLKHNPEAKGNVNLKKIGAERKTLTAMDRILERISKINN
jgi:hypothetical protein